MAKTKNFCKKPLLILSLCLVVVFAAALIIMACVPYAATPYTYTTTVGSSEIVTKYYVSKDSVKVKAVTTHSDGDTSESLNTYDAYVKDGELYVTHTGIAYNSIGEIDAYSIVISDDAVATNTFTKVLKIVSIVGVSLGGVGLVLYFVLNCKKGSTKSTNKSSKKK